MSDLPDWYVLKTLLSCGPDSDINRRTLYHKGRAVAIFNQRMAEWHPEDDAALSALEYYLNHTETTE
jgi:hypothetical protein